ncbi:MAG: RagB/SusD family nutrient uptake outer membrane protein [Bacteroidales bacterium]|nr:RagB/SusD family nutrient uptake outer membrane protein [Bacteroidales bacterium]
MKKIILILSTVFALGLFSCSDNFLIVESKSSILESNYYNSAERLYSGLVAAYDPLQWFDYFYQYNSLNMVSDIMADDIYCGGSNEGDQPILVKAHYYTATPTDVPNMIWTTAYSGVNRANIVVAKAPEVEMDESLKALYVAEAKVLKTFYYNVLWKFWGNIPYYDQNLSFPYICDQMGADQVYEQLITTLEEAIAANVLPMKARAGEEGRVTKAMAYMLYTEIVMYQNDESKFPKALQYMKEIIDSGSFALTADFKNMWEENGEWEQESVWEINYISEGGMRDWGNPLGTGGSVYPVLIGIPGYVGNDFCDGWGFGPVAESAYTMYEEGDIRRDGGILDFSKHADQTGAGYTARWQDTGFFLLKYIGRKDGNHGYTADPNLNYGNNQRVYRYAETLLNAAELIVRGAGSGEAQTYLDAIRNRAQVSSIPATLDNIIEERHLEFVGEGKRYWDLVRTGKAGAVLTASNHLYRTVDWTPQKKYWPIPQSEIDKSAGTLTQNPY